MLDEFFVQRGQKISGKYSCANTQKQPTRRTPQNDLRYTVVESQTFAFTRGAGGFSAKRQKTAIVSRKDYAAKFGEAGPVGVRHQP